PTRRSSDLLGILWTMLNPLLLMIIFTLVFAQIFRVTVDHFTVYFLSPFVLWNFFAQATSWSTASLLSYVPLIKKIYVPKSIFFLPPFLAATGNLPFSPVPLPSSLRLVATPMTHLVEAFRTPIYQGAIPSLHVMISASVAAVGTLVIGWAIFEHYSDRVAYYV